MLTKVYFRRLQPFSLLSFVILRELHSILHFILICPHFPQPWQRKTGKKNQAYYFMLNVKQISSRWSRCVGRRGGWQWSRECFGQWNKLEKEKGYLQINILAKVHALFMIITYFSPYNYFQVLRKSFFTNFLKVSGVQSSGKICC